MNAVSQYIRALSRRDLQALVARSGRTNVAGLAEATLQRRVLRRWQMDLAGFLNQLPRSALERIAGSPGVSNVARADAMRLSLWTKGAILEAGDDSHLGTPYQPVPILLRKQLRIMVPPRGLFPHSDSWPRPVPTEVAPQIANEGEPDTVEELLARANRLIGVRLGDQGRNKGLYGVTIAACLGVREHGYAEADWRGEVEIKTIPLERDRQGYYWVGEDPAVSMTGVDPHRKLAAVLWVARLRSAEAPVVSWYYQERDEYLSGLIARDLHQRPKGGKGATTKGYYVHKRFFVDSGMLATLNGW